MKYDSIILDIDGTIWNTTGIVAEAWNEAIKESGFDAAFVTAEILQKEFGKPMDVIALDLWPNLSEAQRKELLPLCCRYEHEAIERNDSDISYKGVIQTIRELSAQIDFYVVSNCQSGYIELTLKKTGLSPYVKDFECFGDTGLQKDQNISLVCRRNNLKNPVYVGDTQGDCTACKKAGVPFIWAEYGFGAADEYVFKLSEFSELKTAVASPAS